MEVVVVFVFITALRFEFVRVSQFGVIERVCMYVAFYFLFLVFIDILSALFLFFLWTIVSNK